MTGRPRDPVRRVFVLRPDNLGDVVLFTGVLRHLRALYPGARLTLCVRRYVVNLVERSPHVDEIVAWEDLHSRWPAWTRRVRGLNRLELAIRRWQIRRRYAADVAILPVRAPAAEMHATMRVIPAAEKIAVTGCHSNQSPEADRAAAPIYTRRLEVGAERGAEHELEVHRELLALLGREVAVAELHPELWTDEADRAWARANVSRSPGTALVALVPGVSAPKGKAYPSDRYAEVLAGCGERAVSVVLLGAESDRESCAAAARALAGAPGVERVTDLSGASTVRQMVEVLRMADVVVGADAAAVHVAIALGRPTVTIVGGGQYGRFHPWGDPTRNRVVSRPMECYGCDWRCIFASVRCIEEIPAAAVASALAEVLDATAPDPSPGRPASSWV